LIAKEIRGMQVDQLAATLTPAEAMHIDERKLVEARVKVRDLGDLLVPADEAKRRQQQASQAQEALQQQQAEQAAAMVRKTMSDAYKNIAQGQKNTANAEAATIAAALDLLEQSVEPEAENEGGPEGSAD
jgi:phage/plasmid primase-like uncharacterized protein